MPDIADNPAPLSARMALFFIPMKYDTTSRATLPGSCFHGVTSAK